MKIPKTTIFLIREKVDEQAAHFYAETFPNSSVGSVLCAPSDFPTGKAGEVLTVEFKVLGIPCIGQ